MNKKGDHRPRNSAQYERVVELLIMHKANGHGDKFHCYRRFHDQGRSSDYFENLLHFSRQFRYFIGLEEKKEREEYNLTVTTEFVSVSVLPCALLGLIIAQFQIVP